MGSGREWSNRRIAIIAIVVLAGCLLGAQLDTWLAFPNVGAAIVFAPYAIVLAALLATPRRYWWLVLVAATAGDYLPHRMHGGSVALVLLAELVNHARVLLAAVAFGRFSNSGHVRTTRQLAAYLVIVVALSPLLTGLAGAWLVTSCSTTGSFSLVWREWSLANAMAALALLPALSFDTRARLRGKRIVEAAVLAVGLLAVGTLFDTSHVQQVHLHWALPFVLWAAVRFGLGGTSAVVVGVMVLSTWGALVGRGPFSSHAPPDNVLELQVFLLAAAVPVLLLAALIEEQRRTAAELTESRRQYRSIVDDQSELICRFRRDGTYTFANRAYCDAFGLTSDQLAATSVWAAVPPEVHPSPMYLELLAPSSPTATREVYVTTRAGMRWHLWNVRALFDDARVAVEYQAVGRDITERKRADDERRELEARRSVEAALRETDRRKDEFLAILGHELRGPLAPIALALELVATSPTDTETAAWARHSIKRQLEHMTRLLDDLLDISRIKLGKLALRLEPLDLRLAVANAVEVARPLAVARGHELVVELPDERVPVRGDVVRLVQIVQNLLANAAKYTDRGGRIELRVVRDAQEVRLAVRDNGIGLPPEALETIFELYAQGPATTDGSYAGLGIGLHLVQRLVALHGGTVAAYSEGPSRGTELTVRLPVADETLADEPAPPVFVPPAGTRPLRILAVDDNADIADGLAAVLKLWGHIVRVAGDGAAALEVASAFAPEVVLLDLVLPGMGGIEVARRLRQGSEPAPPVLVAMSGRGSDRTAIAGFHHHLAKPIDLDSLRSLLDDSARARR